MTFQESDYPGLKREMVNLIHKYENPSLVVEVLKEIWETHKQVPIYPGIISMCLPSMVKEKKIGELKKGERVLIKTGTIEILGTIKSKKKDSILLENPEMVKRSRSVEVKNKEVQNILAVEKGTLEKIWPTLVFKNADNRR
jgi:translation initiation factor 2 gamma subunit (eIF-2gamma)